MDTEYFSPLNKEEELAIIKKDDLNFTNLKNYLSPLIKKALNDHDIPSGNFNELYSLLIGDITLAVKRFMENDGPNKDYKFSTYFTWYISERINKKAA